MADPPKFAQVTAVSYLTPSVKQIQLSMQEPKTFEYRAGQTIVLYAGFRDGKEIKRQYTLASAPHEATLMLCVKLIPDGAASAYLSSLQVGEQVTFLGPAGKCALPEEIEDIKDEDLLFCVTGTGIAPVRGMLLSYFTQIPPSSSFLGKLFGKQPKIRLLWGLRKEEDIFWEEEFLTKLQKKFSSFQYKITLSKPENNWTGSKGRVSSKIGDIVKTLQKPRIFLIGNGAMIKELTSVLEQNHSKDLIETEAFFTPNLKAPRSK